MPCQLPEDFYTCSKKEEFQIYVIIIIGPMSRNVWPYLFSIPMPPKYECAQLSPHHYSPIHILIADLIRILILVLVPVLILVLALVLISILNKPF